MLRPVPSTMTGLSGIERSVGFRAHADRMALRRLFVMADGEYGQMGNDAGAVGERRPRRRTRSA